MIINLVTRLARRQQLGNLRELSRKCPPIDFASNDYLGLARCPMLRSLVLEEWQQLPGLGATGSRLMTGNSPYTENLESEIAAFHGYETATLFNCGYMANSGLLSAIADSNSTVFFDAEIHASTRAGIRESRACAFPFRHNDGAHLEKRLTNCSGTGLRFICIESLYSTDGSLAPLPEICQIAKEYDAHLIVDEAHATAALGPHGRGLIAEHGLQESVFAKVSTFGKGMGVHGAAIFGSRSLQDVLINFAPTYIYTTALPFLSLAAIRSSYQVFPCMDNERKRLKRLIDIYRAAFPDASKTYIQIRRVKGNEAAKKIAYEASLRGFDIRPMLSPTVRRGHEAVRICLHAFNTERELQTLIEFLRA